MAEGTTLVGAEVEGGGLWKQEESLAAAVGNRGGQRSYQNFLYGLSRLEF